MIIPILFFRCLELLQLDQSMDFRVVKLPINRFPICSRHQRWVVYHWLADLVHDLVNVLQEGEALCNVLSILLLLLQRVLGLLFLDSADQFVSPRSHFFHNQKLLRIAQLWQINLLGSVRQLDVLLQTQLLVLNEIQEVGELHDWDENQIVNFALLGF